MTSPPARVDIAVRTRPAAYGKLGVADWAETNDNRFALLGIDADGRRFDLKLRLYDRNDLQLDIPRLAAGSICIRGSSTTIA